MNRLLAVAFVSAILVCASADDASARCRSGRWFPGKAIARGTVGFFQTVKPVRRAVKGAAVVATAPARAVGRIAFRPQGRLLRCGPNGCH